ncbi:MAG: lipopolysaccharide biosynthesis protein [Nitritalea sp.]
MGRMKQLLGQTALYGVSSILGRSINFLLILLYVRYLSKEDLGAFTGIYALMGFLNILFTYGMETTYFRYATGKGLDPEAVYRSIFTLILSSSLLLSGLLFALAPFLSQWLDYPGQTYLFRWMALILCFDAILAIPFARLRLEQKAAYFAGIKLFNILLNVGLNIFFILYLRENWRLLAPETLPSWASYIYQPDWGVEYIFLANLIANGAILPLMFVVLGRPTFRLDWELLRPMWPYALPLLFMGLAGATNELLSRQLFEYVLPDNFYPGLSQREAAGIFGANFKLAILMSLIIQAFKYAAEPFFFQQATDQQAPETFAHVMHGFILFCTALMVALSVNLYWLGPLILGKEGYLEGLSIVPLLLLGYLFLGIYYNLSIWFKLTDQTKYSLYLTLLGAGITLITVLLLVPKLGFMGAACSTLFAYMSMSALCYALGQKYYPIPYQTGKDLAYLLVGAALSYAGYYLPVAESTAPLLRFLFHNSLFLGYMVLLFWQERRWFATFKR